MQINLNEVLIQIDKYCKEHNNRFGTLEEMEIIHDKKSLNYRSKIDYKISNFFDLLRGFGYGYKNDLVVNGKFKSAKTLSIEDLERLLKQFYNIYHITPSTRSHYKHEYNMPSYSTVDKLVKSNNIELKDIYIKLGFDLNGRDKKENDYIKWLEILKNKIKETGIIPTIRDFSNLGLPTSRWFVVHCNNDKVKDFNTFIEYELGEKPRYFMSKEMATEIIMKLYKELGYSPTKNELQPYICESVIKRIWGGINKMKQELNLEILGENNREKHIDFEKLKTILLEVCNKLIEKDINKTTITTKDITDNCPVVFGTFERIFKQNNITVRELLESNGFNYQKEGQGYVYNFQDGEKTKSQFEFLFSNKLKELGYEYNKHYFRDVRYKTFIPNYKGLLDCDYIIHINDKTIYIEIAGMLRDYKNKYKTPEIISSKSKRKYAEKLNIKENMFIQQNLNYFILFPSDLKEDNLDFLFEDKLNIQRKDAI